MRQLWIAVAILGGMLALTAWNVTVMHQQVQPIVEELHQAAAAAREEDWPQAETLTQTIRTQPTNTPMRQPSPSRPWRGPWPAGPRGSMPPRQPAWRARWRSYSTGNASRRKTCYRDEKISPPPHRWLHRRRGGDRYGVSWSCWAFQARICSSRVLNLPSCPWSVGR